MRAQVNTVSTTQLSWWAWPTFAFLMATGALGVNGGKIVFQILLLALGLGCLAAAYCSSQLRRSQQWGICGIVTALVALPLLFGTLPS